MVDKSQYGKITRVKGISDQPKRLPILGKIRLGIKIQKQGGTEYPKETDYFVCPEEVQKVYGKHPKKLTVMVPIEDLDAVLPTAYIWYGSSFGIKCKGNGEVGYRVNPKTNELDEIKCPCPMLKPRHCGLRTRFLFMLPEVSVSGVYQLSTGSIYSNQNIRNGLEYCKDLLGRYNLLQLEMTRQKGETHHGGKKQIHYLVHVTPPKELNIEMLAKIKANNAAIFYANKLQLPAPDESDPQLDPPDILYDEDDGPNEAITINTYDITLPQPPDETPQQTIKNFRDKKEKKAPGYCTLDQFEHLQTLAKNSELEELTEFCEWVRDGERLMEDEADYLIENFSDILRSWKVSLGLMIDDGVSGVRGFDPDDNQD